jgi:hypothetical protein
VLDTSFGQRLPAGWRPPTPFPLVVRYWDHGRRPDALWTMPWAVDNDGKVVFYVACGPAGKPVGAHLVAHLDGRRKPRGSPVQILTEAAPSGRQVYAQPNHTMN